MNNVWDSFYDIVKIFISFKGLLKQWRQVAQSSTGVIREGDDAL